MSMVQSRAAIALTAGLAMTGLGACSNMMGGGTSQSQHAATQPTVAPEMVRQVQTKLRDSGYYKQGAVDGVWGLGTETAVRSFQHDHTLTSNGQLDVPTLQALNVTAATPSTNDTAPTQPMVTDPAARPANSTATYAPNTAPTPPR